MSEHKGEVILEMAFGWTCLVCGSRNYTDAVDTLPEEAKDLSVPEVVKTQLESEFAEGLWVNCPEEVTCQNCDASFTAIDKNCEEESEEEEEDNDV